MATLTAIPQSRPQSLLRFIREAIRGTHQDFTEGSISRAVFLLAIPMVLEMVMESLFAVVNVLWVTRLGSDAVATVGLTESMLTLVFSVALGVSMSTTAMVARRIGEKDHDGAALAAGQSIVLGIVLSVAMGLPGAWFAKELLALMGAHPAQIAEGWKYTAIVFGSNVVLMLLFLNNAIFRGAGDASIAMRVLWVANLINLIMDPCLIFGLGPFPELGITGAAISTLIGRGVAVAWQFAILLRSDSRVRLRPHHFRICPPVLTSLIRVSSTGVLQFAIAHTSWIALVRMISEFGSVAVAGYTIGIRIFIFVVLPAWGLSGAAATMVGQNLGAKKPERAVKAVYTTALYNVCYMGAVALLFISVPGAIVGWFSADPVEARYAADCLRIVGYGNVMYAVGMVMVQAFNGAGDTVTPTLINVVGFWLCEIPLAWALAFPYGMEVRGVFASIPLAEMVITALGAAMFLRGRWKHRVI
jgi:putative MATE family efflux protein